MTLRDRLADMGACREALEWVGGRTLEQAWKECPQADWLLWYANRTVVDRRLLVEAACACARTALQHVPKGEDRPRVAIETAEAWCRGEATVEQVQVAARAAALVAWEATSAARAAWSAMWSAEAAWDTALAAREVWVGADAAHAAAHASWAGAELESAQAGEAAAGAAAWEAAAWEAARAEGAAIRAAVRAAAEAGNDVAASHAECARLVREIVPCPTRRYSNDEPRWR